MSDKLFQTFCWLCALWIPAVLLVILFRLVGSSAEAWNTFGWRFLISCEWNPVEGKFGALPAILGTLLTTGMAIFLAVPLGFLTAFFLSDVPPWLGKPLSHALDLLAAIPSVIYGMWGLFVLAPIMQKYVQPWMLDSLGLRYLPFVGKDGNGFGFFTAGVVLTLMILPYISAIMRDVFSMTPTLLREAAFGIGCTRWEAAWDITVRYGLRGLLGGIFIGLGRALGETMAVLFIIGNVIRVPSGIFDSGTTIAATLANHFAEADGLMRSVLFALGLILLVLAFGVQVLAWYYLQATKKQRGEV
ncbi:MAG: phosphate ABC transporter permease subunit PstC [Planctomycetia bacterium]|nr:phosphate ABC transporter permease subunit PstC [Planctomycetia bacterium]